jgi:hypothetical protein
LTHLSAAIPVEPTQPE